MELKVQIQDGTARMAVKGRFDFNAHREFKTGYDALMGNADVLEIEIDMSRIDYLDSAALGMLLMLNERAKAANKTVTLAGPKGMVAQVLDVANFGKIFKIK